MKLRKLLSLSIAAILLCFTGCVNKNTLSKHEPITILAPYLECDRLVDLVHKKIPRNKFESSFLFRCKYNDIFTKYVSSR